MCRVSKNSSRNINQIKEHYPLLAELEEKSGPIFTTLITALELYRGAHLSKDPEKNLEIVRKVLAALMILPLNDEAGVVFGALSARLRSEGRKIGDFNEVIAAIALACDQEIVTRDEHFREVAGLRVTGW